VAGDIGWMRALPMKAAPNLRSRIPRDKRDDSTLHFLFSSFISIVYTALKKLASDESLSHVYFWQFATTLSFFD
jgi:hypothetical protein